MTGSLPLNLYQNILFNFGLAFLGLGLVAQGLRIRLAGK
jgi:hypothetical protein